MTAGVSVNAVQDNLVLPLGFGSPDFQPSSDPTDSPMRACISKQSILDLKALKRTRGAQEEERAAQYSYKDARDIVVLATGNAYLEAFWRARPGVEVAEAQVKSAQALYDKAVKTS